MSVDGLFIATDGGSGELVSHVPPLDTFGGGEDNGIEYFKGDVVLVA